MAKQVTAFLGYAIYASYDGEAPDTKDLILLADKDEAEKLAKILNENPRKWGNLAYVEGFECCKTFCVREAIRMSESDFYPTADAAFEAKCQDLYDKEEDEEEDDVPFVETRAATAICAAKRAGLEVETLKVSPVEASDLLGLPVEK